MELSPEKFSYQDILEIVTHFYHQATSDVLIGYHFRRIQDFSTHLPRIASFWELQLLGQPHHPSDLPFDLFGVHLPLNIRKAQVRRWVILFAQTLDEFTGLYQNAGSLEKIPFLNQWKVKIDHFQDKFLNYSRLYW